VGHDAFEFGGEGYVRTGRIMKITIDIIIYEGFNLLEAVGALSVFKYANSHLQRRGLVCRYDVKTASICRADVRSDTGVMLKAEKKLDNLSVPHTALIVGAWDIDSAVGRTPEIVQWVSSAVPRVARVAALCTGAFLLAEAGLLNGRRATTHWAHVDSLKKRHAKVVVESDCIFIRDGALWTSAGVTAGIDLSLALVEQDFGAEIALDVARDLVVFLRRPGGQSQISSHLVSQATRRSDIRAVQTWLLENLDKDIRVVDMAERVSKSIRSFNRRFKEETGTTPSEFLVRARIEAARRMLEEGSLPAKTIASKTGFKTYEAMRKVFRGVLGVTPLMYRERASADIRRNEIELV
jgi:transcriptional regulator GlxA family with amidase domain